MESSVYHDRLVGIQETEVNDLRRKSIPWLGSRRISYYVFQWDLDKYYSS